ncbi:unnamed protein product [Lepidochelys kempii]
MACRRAPGEKRWELVRWYVKEGRFRIEERTLTAFQWLYSPHQHHIVSRADLASPSRSSFAPSTLEFWNIYLHGFTWTEISRQAKKSWKQREFNGAGCSERKNPF